MSVIRVGSSNTYAEGWDAIFGAGAKRPASTSKKKAGASTATRKASKVAGAKRSAKARRRK